VSGGSNWYTVGRCSRPNGCLVNVPTIHQRHLGWDRTLPPVATVPPGTVLSFDVADASGGQLTAASSAEDVLRIDTAAVNPVSGPVHIEGAEPGDALRVELLGFEPSGWGWTAILPGFGLLAEDFPDPALLHWEYDRVARLGDVATIPVEPFPGTVGVAPAAPGPHSVIPPRNVGGNLDVRHLRAGSTLWLPVEVEGALLSLGDTHAAQGDGEVCGTAIESPMRVEARVGLDKGWAPPAPRYETAGPARQAVDGDGALVTTGVGPDLLEGARDATRAMIELLGSRVGLDPASAYMLCSVAADLSISEVVDAPNWVVSCAVHKGLLTA
jgi:acetamidase/formamidase